MRPEIKCIAILPSKLYIVVFSTSLQLYGSNTQLGKYILSLRFPKGLRKYFRTLIIWTNTLSDNFFRKNLFMIQIAAWISQLNFICWIFSNFSSWRNCLIQISSQDTIWLRYPITWVLRLCSNNDRCPGGFLIYLWTPICKRDKKLCNTEICKFSDQLPISLKLTTRLP